MFKSSPVSTQELELESAELLPGRETLMVVNYQPGYGNAAQSGGINASAANGTLDGDNVNVLSVLLASPQTALPGL